MSDSKSPRVLGEGSFGCVLKPAVSCTGKEKVIRNRLASEVTVSKIFENKTDYRKEVTASKRVAKIDKKGRHILVPNSFCDTSYGVVSLHPASDDCEVVQNLRFFPPSTKLYQIKMPYGGVRYDKYIRSSNVDLTTFIKQMIHVLEGVKMMQAKQMCHQDLKASNLLISDSGKVIIIDYSLMLPFNQIYGKLNVRRLRHTYFPYPPEYKVYYAVYKHLCEMKSCDGLLHHVLRNFDSYGRERLEMMVMLHENIPQHVATLYDFTLKNKFRLQEAFTPFASKVDVYSVGTIMVDMDKYISKRGVSEQVLQAYYDAIASMTMVDPRKRATVKQALQKLKSIRV